MTGSELVLLTVNPRATAQLAAINKEIVALRNAADKGAKQCRSMECGSKSRGGKSWLACKCDDFLLCPAHKKTDLQRMFNHKLLECKAEIFIRTTDKAKTATDCGVCAKPALGKHIECREAACKARFHASCLPQIARVVELFACSAACGANLLAVDDEMMLAQRVEEQMAAAKALADVVTPFKNKLKHSSSIRKENNVIRERVDEAYALASADVAQKKHRSTLVKKNKAKQAALASGLMLVDGAAQADRADGADGADGDNGVHGDGDEQSSDDSAGSDADESDDSSSAGGGRKRRRRARN
jgi:hypothetical protein